MGLKTAIEWTDSSWNPWRGCSKDSQACEYCYAWTSSARNPGVLGFWGRNTPRVVMAESSWREPLAWDRKAAASGQPLKVFAWDLADWLEDHDGPLHRAKSGPEPGPKLWIQPDGSWDEDRGEPGFAYDRRPLTLDDVRLRALDVIRQTPHLTWQLLTKRPQNWRPTLERLVRLSRGATAWLAGLAAWLDAWLNGNPPENVWIGATVEDQKQADHRIPELLKIPARVRFLSMEPLLGPVDLTLWIGGSDAAEERRGSDLPFRGERAAENRRPRKSVETEAQSLEESGALRRGLHAGPGDDEGQEASRPGASFGLEALQRPDPQRHDDQPHRRLEGEQPARQPRLGDILGASNSRQGDPREVPPGRRTQQRGRADRGSGCGDPDETGERGAAESDRGRFWGQRSHGEQDRERRPLGGVHWIICGGESGPNARPCDIAWLRSIRDQCKAAGVPFFCKQLGSNPVWGPPLPGFGEPKAGRNENGWRMTIDKKGGDMNEWPEDLRVREWPEVARG